MALADKLQAHVLNDGAEAMLQRYLSRRMFSGAWFGTIGGRGDAPEVADRFTPADLVAVSTLSLNVPGWTAVDLLDRRANELSTGLAAVPADLDLHEANDAALDPLFALQDKLDDIPGVGHVTRSKLLARKRPRLVPLRDQHVLRELVGGTRSSLTRPLRDALRADDEVRRRLQQLASAVPDAAVSPLRALDIVVWMNVHGKKWLPSDA